MATALPADSLPPLSDPSWLSASRNLKPTDLIGLDRRTISLTPGPFRMSPKLPPPSDSQWGHSGRGSTPFSGGNPPPHPAGVIGSSRPGSRIDQPRHSLSPRTSQNSTPHPSASLPTATTVDAHLLSGSGEAHSSLANTNPQSTNLFTSNDETSAGYTLSSSMWATPNSGLPTRLHDFNKNTAVYRPSNVVSALTETEADARGHRQPELSNPDAFRALINRRTPAESDSHRTESTSTFSSPELSFGQTPSAPSTARSFMIADSANVSNRIPLTGHFNRDRADSDHYGLGFKGNDYTSTPAQRTGKENNENSWPPPLSTEEEAFYSKSNVTQSQNAANHSYPPPLREASPGLWKPRPAAHRSSASPSSPPNAGGQSALGSPFLAPQYITELMNQMVMRIDQLERNLAKQDVDINVLKTGLNVITSQPQPPKNMITGSAPNHTFTPIIHPRSMNNTSVATVPPNLSKPLPVPLGPPQFTGHVPQPHRMNLSNTPPGILDQTNNLNASHVYHSHANFGPRQFGPLDYAMGRSGSLNGSAPMLHQPAPLAAPLTGNHPGGGLGGVNYRALLAGDTDCDYEYFIRRITEHNDQQSSIFLQQKLKQSAVASSTGFDQAQSGVAPSSNLPREEITRLVIEYSLELMSNRFGNFLVSRAIEHATPDERMMLAERIRGHIIALASDTFATHCLQKMIDVDEEENNQIRWLISQELLKKKETVTHKSAGHVWARLLSVGGSSSAMHLHASGLNVKKPNGRNQYGSGVGSPGELERSLNELLRGQWAKTAKDEVGSLIVQSVLENWSEAEKTDVIEELLADIFSCAIQQWGNFVILHLIEHSSGDVQKRLFDRLTDTQLACELSIDNFGAKAIEKVMKVSGMDSAIVEDYVRGICEYGHGRPALIDIACHQAGAQVLTLLFTSAPNPIRELMIQTVRRNGVTMKSSKAGSKIWFLVERTRAWVGH